MTIERHLIVEEPDNGPIISRAVAHGDRVYICGITGDPGVDVTAQTKLALARIDQLLARPDTAVEQNTRLMRPCTDQGISCSLLPLTANFARVSRTN